MSVVYIIYLTKYWCIFELITLITLSIAGLLCNITTSELIQLTAFECCSLLMAYTYPVTFFCCSFCIFVIRSVAEWFVRLQPSTQLLTYTRLHFTSVVIFTSILCVKYLVRFAVRCDETVSYVDVGL